MVQHTPGMFVTAALIVLLLTALVVLFRSPRKAITGLVGGAVALLLCLLIPAIFVASFRRANSVTIVHDVDQQDGRLTRSLERLDKLDQNLRSRVEAVMERHADGRVTIKHGKDQVIIKTSQSNHDSSRPNNDPAARVAAVSDARDNAEVTNESKESAHDSATPDNDATAAVAESIASFSTTETKRRIDDPFTPEVDQEWNPLEEQQAERTTESTSREQPIASQPAEDERPLPVKPDWIYDTLSTAQEPHRLTLRCGPFGTMDEVERHEDETIQEGALKYADWYLHAHGKRIHRFGDLLRLQIPLERLHECLAATYDEVHLSDVPDVEPMPVRYLLLEFDADFRRQVIDVYWQESLSVARSLQAGLGGIGVLSILGVVLGAVKLDALTRGQHRGKVIAVAGLIATTALLTFSACSIYFVRG